MKSIALCLLSLFIFSTVALGDSSIASNSCGCSYENATGCSDRPTSGTIRLKDHFVSRFGGLVRFTICRVRDGEPISLKYEGRALNLFVDETTDETTTTGRNAFDYAVSIACDTGIQEVIFNRRIWTQEHGERSYGGSDPHTEHVHIGLNRCGAENWGL